VSSPLLAAVAGARTAAEARQATAAGASPLLGSGGVGGVRIERTTPGL
jgi:hypothetical protein